MSSKVPSSGTSVGSMVIDDQCYESYPCQHKVTINGTSRGLWSGIDIAAWVEDQELDVPKHFCCYLEKEQLLKP
jgi:hypothetical protein